MEVLKEGDLLTIHEVAELLRCSYRYAYKLVAETGEIKSVMVGKRQRVHRDALNEYLFGSGDSE